MSYILDALKRAEAERERGAAPGLHTRHQVPSGRPGAPSATRNMGWALAAGLALVMLALYFWFLPTPDPTPTATVAPAVSTAPVTMVSPAPAVVAVAPEAILPMAPAPAVVTPAPKAQALPPLAAPASQTVAAPPAKSVKPAEAAAPATPASAATPANQAATPLPAPAPVAVPLLAELPQNLRSQIPQITITGSVYSDSPAQRLLLVNNLVLTQGSQVASDLTLEEIQPRSSVLSFKGTRFRVMH